jgi:predicted nucleic acid-binding protein
MSAAKLPQVFFDSNVILYALDASAGHKQTIAQSLLHEALANNSAVISFQVVQETLHVAGRKFARSVEPPDLRALLVDVLTPLWQVMPNQALYVETLAIQDRFEYSFYDSLIIAAALQAGCKRLLSEDFQHGQKIGALRIEDPFRG